MLAGGEGFRVALGAGGLDQVDEPVESLSVGSETLVVHETVVVDELRQHIAPVVVGEIGGTS